MVLKLTKEVALLTVPATFDLANRFWLDKLQN